MCSISTAGHFFCRYSATSLRWQCSGVGSLQSGSIQVFMKNAEEVVSKWNEMTPSHPVVIRTAAAFGRYPGDDLVRILNIAGFAMHAVGWIQADALPIGLA